MKTLLLLFLVVAVASSGASATTRASLAADEVRALFPKEALLLSRGDGGVGAVYAVNADGSGLKRVPEGLRSPNGRWRAFVRCVSGCASSESDDRRSGLFIGDVGGRHARRVVTARRLGVGSWSPDSRRLAYSAASGFSDGFVGVVDRRSGRTGRRFLGVDGPTWSPDGRRLLVHAGRLRRLQTIAVDHNDTHELGDAFHGSWSPDGKRVAFVRDNALESVAAVGTGVRTVLREADLPGATSFAQLGDAPEWSPRGDWIAIAATAGDADWGLYLVRADGSEVRRVLDLGPYYGTSYEAPVWSPSGRYVAARVMEHIYSWSIRISDIVVVDVRTGAIERVTQGWKYGYENTPLQWHPQRRATGRIPGTPVSWTLPSDTLVGATEVKTTRVVDRLAADGPRAAYTFEPPTYDGHSREPYRDSPLNCGESWDARTQTVLRLRVPCSGKPWGPQGIAVAGDRLGWIENTLGAVAASNSFGVYWATTAAPAPAPVLGRGNGLDFSDAPRGDMLGDGGLIVFDTWKRNPSGCVGSSCYGTPKTGGVLYGVESGEVVQLAASDAGVTPLSVDDGRVLVDRGDGVLELLRGDGVVLRRFQLNSAIMHGARLQRGDLVVLTSSALEVTDANTGAFLRRWSPPPDAELVDVQDGVALLIAGTQLHLLRLTDGRDTVVDVPGSPPIRAQLEPGVLFYSYRAADSAYPGRVVFARL